MNNESARSHDYREIFDAVNDAIFIHDADSGLILDVNRAFESIFGRSRESIIGHTVASLSQGDPNEANQQALALIHRTRDAGEQLFEWPCLRHNGEAFWAEVHLRAALIDGHPRILAIARDISHRKQIQQTLQRERDTLHRILNTARVIVLTLDVEGNISLINHYGCELLGYREEELLGRNWFHTCLPQPEGQMSVWPVFEQLMQGDGAARSVEYFENHILTRHGETRLIGWHNQFLTNADGTINGSLSTGEDITERRRMEHHQHNNERRQQMLLDLNRAAPSLDEQQLCERALDIAVEVTDSQVGYLHLINDDQRTISLVAWNGEALKLCTAAHDNHYPIDHAGIWADAFRQRRVVVHNDYPGMSGKHGYPEGHFAILRHMSAPVIDGDQVRMILGVGNKPTPYDDCDQLQLQAAADEVMKFVMRHRAEHALALAKEEAEAASRAKSAFLANMSHELRTPLNAILGYAQLLSTDTLLNDRQHQGMATIQRSGNYLLSLINDILDLARIEAERLELVAEPIDLMSLFSEIAQLFQLRAEQKGITFHYQPSQLPRVASDARRLRQVVLNLLTNAIKFTEQGEVVLHTTFHDGQLEVVVSDSGVGIPADQVQRIFEPFQQLGDARFRSQGTGLGLAISRQLIELMHGTIEVKSQPGHGSRFCFSLPLIVLDHETPDLLTQGSNQRSIIAYSAPDNTAPLRILVVDDDPDNRTLLRSLLEPLGFAVSEVDDGLEALDKVAHWRPDLVLMDLRLPGLDGLAVTRRLHAETDSHALPVIAISGSSFAHDREQSLAAGCRAHLDKPLDYDLLLGTLGEQLGIEWIYRQAEEIPGESEEPPLSPQLHARLCELLEHGDIRAFNSELRRLRETGEGPTRLLTRLQTLSARFDLHGLQRELGAR